MKKLIFSLVLLVGFALSTMTVQSSFAQDSGGTPITHVDNEGSGSGSDGTYGCTAKVQCWRNLTPNDRYGSNWQVVGEISCNVSGKKEKVYCEVGFNWVKCDGVTTVCN